MARREQTTPTDPDTEAARQERAALEGETATKQRELEGIGAAKKTLEEGIEARKTAMHQELVDYRKDVDEQKRKLDAEILEKKNIKAGIEKDIETAEAAKKMALASQESAETRAAAVRDERDGIITNIGALRTEEKKLNETIATRRNELQMLTSDKEHLELTVPELVAKRDGIQAEHDELVPKVAEHKAYLGGVEDRRGKANQALTETQEALKQTTEKKVVADAELSRVQQETAEHKLATQKEDERLNIKAGNVARAQKAADDRIAAMNELKKHFTTQELLKVGIKD